MTYVLALLKKHRKSAFYAEGVTHRVDRKQERNNKAATLVDLLHFLLHHLQSAFRAVFGRSNLSYDAVLFKSRARVSLNFDVDAGVNVRSIDDQGLSIGKALADIEVASVAHSPTRFLELEDDIFLALT